MNKLFSIILTAFLLLPISVSATDVVYPVSETSQIKQGNTLDEDIVESEEEIQYKQPISKKKIIKKFLIAMGAVAGSSILLFVMLSAYNRMREKYLGQAKDFDGEISLETPDDIDEAIKTFIDKTDWN